MVAQEQTKTIKQEKMIKYVTADQSRSLFVGKESNQEDGRELVGSVIEACVWPVDQGHW